MAVGRRITEVGPLIAKATKETGAESAYAEPLPRPPIAALTTVRPLQCRDKSVSIRRLDAIPRRL